MIMTNIQGLFPIIGEGARVLILGSMPSAESLRLNQYYGNRRNHFWSIIYSLFDLPLEKSYEKRIQFIKDKEIALWDVIHSCERVGSLDSNIKNAIPNDFKQLLTNRGIKAIFFNGTKAKQVFFKHFNQDMFPGIHFFLLPSSSPVPGKNIKSLQKKIEIWRQIRNYV
ncbi:DNA-deoxyinosine glycosylase [Alkaliphilus crotonatoxidans]